MREYCVDVIFGPGRVDHQKRRATESKRIVIHKETIISTSKEAVMTEIKRIARCVDSQ